MAPEQWAWKAYPTARHRFDPTSGRFRVRYAASSPVAAAAERFPSRRLAEPHGDLWLVELTGPPAALHLTHQTNLDALGLDDRINIGRLDDHGPGGDPLLSTSQSLADAVWDWWEGSPPPLVYRTRSVPSARSIAFSQTTAWQRMAVAPLRAASALTVRLVTHHGFDIPDNWL